MTPEPEFCLYLSFDWCFASMPCTVHQYSLHFGNIKPFSDIKILAYFSSLCAYIGQIDLLVWAIVQGDVILLNDV